MLLFIVLTIFVIINRIVNAQSQWSLSNGYNDCPSEQYFQPCKCILLDTSINDKIGQIECGRAIGNPVNMRYIFQESYPKGFNSFGSSKEQFHYDQITLHSSAMEKLVNRTFGKFTFDSIIIKNNYYLSSIELLTFFGTNSVTKKLIFDSNQNLFNENDSVLSIFSIIRTFNQLETLLIHRCRLSFIPKNAFTNRTLQNLTRISLMNNEIKTISSNLFTELINIRILDLSHNKINHIEPNALRLRMIDDKCKRTSFRKEDIYYFIDLSANNITSESMFEQFPIVDVDCSLELKLNNNSIEYLQEQVYRPLFKHYTKIVLYANPLNCEHCEMSWLLKSRFCLPHNNTIQYYLVIDSVCDRINLYYYLTNCQPYLSRYRKLHLSETTSSAYAIKIYTLKYPNDFQEQDPTLLKCLNTDFSNIENMAKSTTAPISMLIDIMIILKIVFFFK